MTNYHNLYIRNVNQYVNEYTPISFFLDEYKYNSITSHLDHIEINSNEKELIVACYTLLYTAISYHLMINEDTKLKPYYILVGDYISSYVLEILYKNKLFKLQQIFITNTKKILINIISNNKMEDSLLSDIINFYKG